MSEVYYNYANNDDLALLWILHRHKIVWPTYYFLLADTVNFIIYIIIKTTSRVKRRQTANH